MTPETRLQTQIQAALRSTYGSNIFVTKIHGGPYQDPGLPDLILCCNGRYVGLEVKVANNRLSLLQDATLTRIRTAGGTAECVRSVAEALSVVGG